MATKCCETGFYRRVAHAVVIGCGYGSGERPRKVSSCTPRALRFLIFLFSFGHSLRWLNQSRKLPRKIHKGTLPTSYTRGTLNLTELKHKDRASLVAQWLRVCLPMQDTRVRALVWEDPTCRGAAGPVMPQLLSLRVWSLCSATREAAVVRARAPR